MLTLIKTALTYAGITIGVSALVVTIALLAWYCGFRRARTKRAAVTRDHRLSISCQGLSTPLHLSPGKTAGPVLPPLELSPVASPELKM